MDIPRRAKMLEWSKAERAIFEATQVVEAMPPDVALTDAVVFLGKAREKVADYVDYYLESSENPVVPDWLYPLSKETFVEILCKKLSNSLEHDTKTIVYVEQLSSGITVRRMLREGELIPSHYKKMSLLKWQYGFQANRIATILEDLGIITFFKGSDNESSTNTL